MLSLWCLYCVPLAGAFPQELLIGKPNTNYPPFHWTDEDGRVKGLCPEIIIKAARRIGITKVTYTSYPWRRMLENAKKGKVDAVMPLFYTPERGTYLFFPDESLAFETNVFFTLKDSNINYSGDLSVFKTQRIGAISGYSYGSLFDDSDLEREHATNEEMLLDKLQAGRFTIGIGNILVLKHFAKEKGIDIRILEPYVSKDPLYIGFSRKATGTELAENFSKAISALRNTEEYQQILKKYGEATQHETD